jgi:hypothetical protein
MRRTPRLCGRAALRANLRRLGRSAMQRRSSYGIRDVGMIRLGRGRNESVAL